MPLMSVLEFIASLKWPVVVLAAMVWIARTLKKPAVTEWLREWMTSRNFRAKLGAAEVETMTAAVQEAAAEAVAAPCEDDSTQVEPEQLRRENIDRLVRQSALWGWTVAASGGAPPNAQIDWDHEQPRITLRQSPADQQAALRAAWWSQHLRGAPDPATGPAPGSPTEGP